MTDDVNWDEVLRLLRDLAEDQECLPNEFLLAYNDSIEDLYEA